jgi:hypothetical protein
MKILEALNRERSFYYKKKMKAASYLIVYIIFPKINKEVS